MCVAAVDFEINRDLNDFLENWACISKVEEKLFTSSDPVRKSNALKMYIKKM